MSDLGASEIQLRLPSDLGFGGETLNLTIFFGFVPGDPRHSPPGSEGGSGEYQAVFVLARSGERSFQETSLRVANPGAGNSYLAITSPAVSDAPSTRVIEFTIDYHDRPFILRTVSNAEGFLAQIKSDPFYSEGMEQATLLIQSVTNLFLSNISAHLDVPLHVEQLEIIEVRTQRHRIITLSPHQPVRLAIEATGNLSKPEYAHSIALYREALNCNAPIYRFLCLFKILELSRSKRERIGRTQKKSTAQQRIGETLPSLEPDFVPWLNSLFYTRSEWSEQTVAEIFIPEVRGQKINRLFDGPLRQLRHRIAHGILDSGEFLFLDDPERLREVTRWLPLFTLRNQTDH